MNELTKRYEIPERDAARGRNLKFAAAASPVVLGGVPLVLTFALTFLFGTTPPIAATILFLGLIVSMAGFVLGLGLTGFFVYRYSGWTAEMRERIASHGIRAEEIEWFRRELKPSEKRALRQLAAGDPMLADAYRETLASRLTATRIIRSAQKEKALMQRRRNKLRSLKSQNSSDFLRQVDDDLQRIGGIHDEARSMLAEAESRLQIIEAAAVRGTSLADSELALKKLSARTAELPLALESARMADEIRRELEAEDNATIEKP
ncbi:MAG: hypothetical protein ACK4S4_09550 [Pyrinomonadaceae bacterium]